MCWCCWSKIIKIVHACRNYSLPKLARFIRHTVDTRGGMKFFCSINKQSITKAIYAPAVWPLLWILLLQLMKNELFARAQSISVQGSARRSMKAIWQAAPAGRPEFTLQLRMLLATISPTDRRWFLHRQVMTILRRRFHYLAPMGGREGGSPRATFYRDGGIWRAH